MDEVAPNFFGSLVFGDAVVASGVRGLPAACAGQYDGHEASAGRETRRTHQRGEIARHFGRGRNRHGGGGVDPAIAKFSHAAELAANWADPLKYWGDALAAQGKREEALPKYQAALKLALAWAELRQAAVRARARA